MTLSSQVVSLPLAKKLKELGVKAPSHAWWQATYSHPMDYRCKDCAEFGDTPHPCDWHLACYDDNEPHFDLPSYTASELMEMLPYTLEIDGKEVDLIVWKTKTLLSTPAYRLIAQKLLYLTNPSQMPSPFSSFTSSKTTYGNQQTTYLRRD